MEPFATAVALTAAGALLVVATLLSRVSERLGLPVLLLVLGVGMAAGSEGIGRIPFDDYRLAFRAGTLALVLILFDGGLGTSPDLLRRMLPRAGILATLGVVLTAAFVAWIAMLLGVPGPLAMLIGAIVSSTDAAAVFAVLRGSRVRLRGTAGATLEMESGMNDPVAVLLTVLATDYAVHGRGLDASLLVQMAEQVGFGFAFGFGVGFLGRWVLRAFVLPAPGLYPVLTVALALLAFGLPTLLNGSGFLATYLAALVLTAGHIPYRASVRRVHDALAWLSQITMFLLLGLLVFPSHLGEIAPTALPVAAGLGLVARPAAVYLCLLPFRMTSRERAFIAWVGLRGAVPIVLATFPVLQGVPGSDQIFDVVFFVVLVNVLVHGSTVAWLARRLGIARPEPPAVPASVELVSLREYPGEFTWYAIERASAAAGATVEELPLPDGCVLTLLLRGDDIVNIRGNTIIREGDHVCMFVRDEERRFVDLLFGRGDEDAP